MTAALTRGRVRLEGQFLLFCLIFGIVALCVLYPIALIVIKSFTAGGIGQQTVWSLAGWRQALTDPTLSAPVWNTIKLLFAIQVVSLPTAVVVAWLLGRTDLPARGALEFMFWLAFFLPPLSVTLGWIVLLDPQSGALNHVLAPLVGGPLFDIYSFTGIVWAHLSSASIAIKVMLLTPTFRNLDASFEEVARISGAGRVQTLARVVLPLVMPAILGSIVLAMIRTMQTFEVEMVLGPPFDFWVYGTKIYNLVAQEPPEFGAATALATVGLILITPLILLQRRLITRKDYGSMSGRMRLAPMPLGRWRWPAFAVVASLVTILTVIPVVFVLMASFMKLFGFFDVPDPWTTEHWARILADELFLTSLVNTLKLAAGTAIVSVVLCALVAYFAVRSRYPGRAALDFLSWLPFAMPGILLGLGLLYVFLGNPLLRLLYGSTALMVVAIVIANMTLGTQVLKTNMVQLGAEIEEAARTSGASWGYTFRQIVVPILMPTLMLVGVLNFIAAARDISSIVLLAANATKTLSLLQLDFIVEGRTEAAAVISVIVIALTTGAALAARLLGLRADARNGVRPADRAASPPVP